MSTPPGAAARRKLLIKLAVVAAGLAVVAILVMRGVDLRAWAERGLNLVRSVGPVPFFLGMAILPAFGCPLSVFTLLATSSVPQLSTGWIVTLVVLCITANMALTYWLSRYALRPFLMGLVRKLGYELPKAGADDWLTLAVLVRVTPGPPFFVQSYLLGLAEVPFRTYMIVSFLISVPQAIALMFFGDSLVHGRGKLAMIAVGIIVALVVAVHWVRRRFTKRKMAAEPGPSAS